MTHTPDLPLSFRGYDRDTIDQFLEQVEDAYQWLAAERDGLRDQVDQLKQELEGYRRREDQVKESIARAEQVAAGIKAQAEREIAEERTTFEASREGAEAERAAIVREAELLRSDAEAEVETLMRNARAQADALVRNAQLDAERLTQELTASAAAKSQAAERVLDETRARLATMVTDLIRQLPVGTASSFGPRPPA